MTATDGSAVIIQEGDGDAPLAGWVGRKALPAATFPTVADLFRGRAPHDISVLVLLCGNHLKGTDLVHLARLNLEFPWVQKLLILQEPLPLPVREYLAACGVDLMEGALRSTQDLARLALTVDRLKERSQWLVPRQHLTTPRQH